MGGLDDIFGGPPAPAAAAAAPAGAKVVLPAEQGNGMQVRSTFVKDNGRLCQSYTIENMGSKMPSVKALASRQTLW